MDIILFNGPPSSGKDEAAKFLRDNWDALDLPGNPILRRMSHPNKEAFAGLVGAPIDPDGIVAGWEERKDQPSSLLGGKSYRQWQIEFSEKFMKPLYGDDIFGRLFVEHAQRAADSTVYLVPDCGFEVEAQALTRLLPQANTYLVRIYRPGKDFTGDSRSYITANSTNMQTDIQNDSDLERFHHKLSTLMHLWLSFRRPH